MDPVTRCLHCGRRLIPVLSANGRTELKCVWCDAVDRVKAEPVNRDGRLLTEPPILTRRESLERGWTKQTVYCDIPVS
jgi:hypothetical protein